MREMKDSGIAWVGTMPADWNVKRGKFTLKLLNRPLEETDDVITCFREGEVTLRKNRRTEGFTVSLKEIGYQGIEPGDLVIHGMDGFAGSIGISDSRGKSSPVLVVCDSDENKRFIMYYLRSMAYNDVFTALATGIRVRSCDLRWNKLAELPYILPNIQEQEKIVHAIESRTEKVNALITNVQSQIEKLKAYKLSMITEIVTKGLDTTVPMRDSGIEWIGYIPEQWNVTKARRIISSTQNGITRRDLAESKGQIVLKLKNISADGNIDYSYINRIELTEKELSAYALQEGDFLFVRVNGSKSLVGKCAIYADNGEVTAYNDHIIRVRINDLCSKEFFHYYLLSIAGKTEIEHHTSTSAGQFTISGEGLRDIWLVLPPLDIQKQLCCFLDHKCMEIDRLIAIKQAKIEKLEQYKKSLIYEYVTGKKEVS